MKLSETTGSGSKPEPATPDSHSQRVSRRYSWQELLSSSGLDTGFADQEGLPGHRRQATKKDTSMILEASHLDSDKRESLACTRAAGRRGDATTARSQREVVDNRQPRR